LKGGGGIYISRKRATAQRKTPSGNVEGDHGANSFGKRIRIGDSISAFSPLRSSFASCAFARDLFAAEAKLSEAAGFH
jgi:hypothetical protein